MATPTALRPNLFAICCDSKRRYVGHQPLSVGMLFSFKDLERSLNGSRFWPLTKQLTPGEYEIFIQTKRLMRGWPKSPEETFDKASNIVVTSNDILHLKILPDVTKENSGKP